MISSAAGAIVLAGFACWGGGGDEEPQPPTLERIVAESSSRIAGALQRARKLRFTTPVPARVLTPAQVRAHVLAYMERDYPAARLEAVATAHAAWGFLPRGYDLQAAHLRLFDGGVAAFYDARDKVIIVPAGADAARLPEVLVHEMAHGLQDQHLPLDDLVRPDRNDDDQSWAHAAVIEGEAECLRVRLGRWGRPVAPELLEQTGRDNRTRLETLAAGANAALAGSPLVLRENLIFPYDEGTRFVAEAWRRQGPTAMDAVYKDLPASTEQIIHPERYFETRDDPTPIGPLQLRRALGDGWQRVSQNVLGEFRVRTLLRGVMARAEADAAAAGWDGLRYAVYRGPNGELCLAFRSVWDSETDAREFAAALVHLREKRAIGPELWPGGVSRWMRARAAAVRHVVRGREVLGLEGAPRGRAEACWAVVAKR
jgi:hypothetical protein